MFALVVVEVDELFGHPRAAECRLDDQFGRAGKGDDSAVVVGVGLAIEQPDAWDNGDGFDDAVDDLRAAAFAEVGDAFDDLLHGSAPFERA